MHHKTTLFLLLLLAAFPWVSLTLADPNSPEIPVAEPKPSVISRLLRRRAVVRETPTMVHRFAMLREKPEDRPADRLCVAMNDEVKWGGCVEVVEGEVEVIVEFIGPVEWDTARLTCLHGENLLKTLVIQPGTLPNPF